MFYVCGHFNTRLYTSRFDNQTTAHKIAHAASGLHFAERRVSSSFTLNTMATVSKQLADELNCLRYPFAGSKASIFGA